MAADDEGAGSVLALAIVAASVILIGGQLALGAALVQRQQALGAADAAALAAADTLLGVVPGIPCEVAATVADADGARIADCELDGYLATVTVSARVGIFEVTARSRAGPPS